MSESLLIFTFNPIQSFIAEARRADDMYTASRILVELASAAGRAIEGHKGKLIFPARITDDIPNRIIAVVDSSQVSVVSGAAKVALIDRWKQIAADACRELIKIGPSPDNLWKEIWGRQTEAENVWEVFWASVPLDVSNYPGSISRLQTALDAVKRTRHFNPSEESGPKDTLSGKRSALRTIDKQPSVYWSQVSDLRLLGGGRERLDALGAVKRFYGHHPFPSTSAIASGPFLDQLLASPEGKRLLKTYKEAIDQLGCFRVSDDLQWPYDGDLFYLETLTEDTLKEDYHLSAVNNAYLINAQEALKLIYKIYGRPSPYYTLIVMDGDSMGEKVSNCELEEGQNLSKRLVEFSVRVRGCFSVIKNARLIFSGGDDVLALAPLKDGLKLSQVLADNFDRQLEIGSLSAGIAIGHHKYPLRLVLQAAREAEHKAKHVADGQKNAVCVTALKRSGETRTACSHWRDIQDNIDLMVEHLSEDRISSRFVYNVLDESRVASALPFHAQKAILKRLIARHKSPSMSENQQQELLEKLLTWTTVLNLSTDRVNIHENGHDREIPQGLMELGTWMVLARFIAEGGGE